MFTLGREGIKLRLLEQDTDCRIVVPGRDSPSDIIKIIGPRDGIEKAMHEIQLVSDKQVGFIFIIIIVTILSLN